MIMRDHIFSNWISEVLPPAVVGPDISCERSVICDPRPVKRWFPTEATGDTRRALCQSCNAGWITGLEGAVQLLLPPMINGHSAQLMPHEQVTVATWAVLQAVIFEGCGSSGVMHCEEL